MSDFFNFINTNVWAAVLFVLLCVVISLGAIVGLMLLWYDISVAIETKQIDKLEKKYPELFAKIREYGKAQEKCCLHYSKYIKPVKEKIDELVQDNYIQDEEKSKQLRVLRDEYAKNYNEYGLILDKTMDLINEIDSKVTEISKTDKKLKKAWDIK